MSRTLYGLSVSPWTERARWALDHHGIAYEYHEHVPMIGEVFLRMKARSTKASVPLLADGDQIVMGSFAIVKHAERVGRGASLFPSGEDDAIAGWVDKAERMVDVGRAWFMRRMLKDKEAQAESLPSFVPGGLRSAFAPSAAMAVRFLSYKYDVPTSVDALVDETLRPLLHELRETLDRHRDDVGKTTYILGPSFTAADLVLASAMQAITPHERVKLGPASQKVWSNPKLVDEFGDLVEWRDAIYEKHR